jgi:hypothetical protein
MLGCICEAWRRKNPSRAQWEEYFRAPEGVVYSFEFDCQLFIASFPDTIGNEVFNDYTHATANVISGLNDASGQTFEEIMKWLTA